MIRAGKSIIVHNRTKLLLVAFFVIGAVMILRLFQLQIVRHGHYEAVASGQHDFDTVILQSRGEIFMHGGPSEVEPLAINRKLNLVYAVPTEITNPRNTAESLAEILESDEEKRRELEEEIYNKVNKENDPYEPIAHRIGDDKAMEIKELKLAGIYFRDELDRFYPEAEAAAHVTGFFGHSTYKTVGQYGVEGYFEEELAGEAGKMLGAKDVYGRIIPVGESEIEDAEDGVDIVLTLDKVIQNKAYEIIKEAVEGYGSEDGSIIVMDPANGNIKAMANYPSFNPNNYGEAESIDVFRNLAVSAVYEPGSIFKVITMATGLDSGAISVDDKYFDEGFIDFGKYKVKNADDEVYGEVNMTEVLENSINTGAVHIALEAGRDTFYNYVKDFGFGVSTGASIFGEAAGDISSLEKSGDIYVATASYGQGITITSLQMASAVATIVNNGKLVKPMLVDYMIDNHGKRMEMPMDGGDQVISPKTAIILKAMMVSVVKNGHGSKAAVPGYYIGGKTGTAEIAQVEGGYGNENNHSFIGFGPLENSRFVIMVKLSKPKWGRFSAVTAAPTFAKMASFLLQYYQVAPEYSNQ